MIVIIGSTVTNLLRNPRNVKEYLSVYSINLSTHQSIQSINIFNQYFSIIKSSKDKFVLL